MISIYDEPSAVAALNQSLEPTLRLLLTDRLSDAADMGLSKLTHIVVIQPDDTEAMLIDELGWSPLTNPIDEIGYGTPGFIPYWSWLEDLGDWYELVHTVGNAGYALLMLVQKDEAVLPELLLMCRGYCEDGDQQCAF